MFNPNYSIASLTKWNISYLWNLYILCWIKYVSLKTFHSHKQWSKNISSSFCYIPVYKLSICCISKSVTLIIVLGTVFLFWSWTCRNLSIYWKAAALFFSGGKFLFFSIKLWGWIFQMKMEKGTVSIEKLQLYSFQMFFSIQLVAISPQLCPIPRFVFRFLVVVI